MDPAGAPRTSTRVVARIRARGRRGARRSRPTTLHACVESTNLRVLEAAAPGASSRASRARATCRRCARCSRRSGLYNCPAHRGVEKARIGGARRVRRRRGGAAHGRRRSRDPRPLRREPRVPRGHLPLQRRRTGGSRTRDRGPARARRRAASPKGTTGSCDATRRSRGADRGRPRPDAARRAADEGFLRVRRLALRNVYADGSTSEEPTSTTSCARASPTRWRCVLYDVGRDGAGRVRVALKTGVRPPVYLRRHLPLLQPDERERLDAARRDRRRHARARGRRADGCRAPRGDRERRRRRGYDVRPADVSAARRRSSRARASPTRRSSSAPRGVARGAASRGRRLRDGGGRGVVVIVLDEAIARCRRGDVPDMKTEIALLRLRDAIGLPALARPLRRRAAGGPLARVARRPASRRLRVRPRGAAASVDRERSSREVERAPRGGATRRVHERRVRPAPRRPRARCCEEAATLGDVLVVAVNDDASVARAKGPGRPLVPRAERAEVVAAVAGVDFVHVFPDRTVGPAARARCGPHVHAKGRDYALDASPRRATNRAAGHRDGVRRRREGHATSAPWRSSTARRRLVPPPDRVVELAGAPACAGIVAPDAARGPARRTGSSTSARSWRRARDGRPSSARRGPSCAASTRRRSDALRQGRARGVAKREPAERGPIAEIREPPRAARRRAARARAVARARGEGSRRAAARGRSSRARRRGRRSTSSSRHAPRRRPRARARARGPAGSGSRCARSTPRASSTPTSTRATSSWTATPSGGRRLDHVRSTSRALERAKGASGPTEAAPGLAALALTLRDR